MGDISSDLNNDSEGCVFADEIQEVSDDQDQMNISMKLKKAADALPVIDILQIG